jgi:endoglucanase
LRPTANTGVALVDAYLWVKTPGESDGRCDSTEGSKPRQWDYTAYNPWNVTGAAQGTWDPLWGMVDPVAGLWFTQQALQLAQDATPPLL